VISKPTIRKTIFALYRFNEMCDKVFDRIAWAIALFLIFGMESLAILKLAELLEQNGRITIW
jgi:hypothetical protein